MEHKQPRFNLYEIVRVAAPEADHREIEGKEGFITARRRRRNGAWVYAIWICPVGLGWSCPGARTWLVAESELAPTGESYRGATYGKWEWPPSVVPRYTMHERVRLAASPDTEGVVCEVPECDAAGTCWYQVRVCPLHRDCDCAAATVQEVPEAQLLPTGEMSERYSSMMAHPPEYAEAERVIIRSENEKKRHLNGRLGFIASMPSPGVTPGWGYAVAIYGCKLLWWFSQDELEATGTIEPEAENANGTVRFHDEPSTPPENPAYQ